ncbi:MAG: DUF1028 domain-containing protein [Actinomycetota bacterium]
MTYSIVARDPDTGQIGVAVQSHFFSVGPIVPWTEPGVGAVATQAHAEVSYGPRGLELMRDGTPAGRALGVLVLADKEADRRQVAMVDAMGRVAAHTGDLCIAEAGDRQGEGVSVQANMMLKPTVPDAMLGAYEGAGGDLADRMLAALDAAQAEGGDIRGKQSAAMLIVRGRSSGKPWADRVMDLRVEDHPEPLVELRRLVVMRRAYDAVDRAELAALNGEMDTAAREYAAADEGAGGNVEPSFWAGVSLAAAGQEELARELLAKSFAAHDGWKELLRRLPAADMFPDDPGLIERLLG